jgi:hypothetical protein
MKTVNFWSPVVFVLFILFFLQNEYKIYGQQTSYLVHQTTNLVDGTIAPYNQVQPGDTLFLEYGIRDFLLIRNFTGTQEKPVILTNLGGVVTLNSSIHYGISIQNCRYFRLTGQNDTSNFYGIKITGVASGAGIGIGAMSSDYEIDHISIENCPIAAIYAKTDPDCSFLATRDKFIQFNTVIHDTYISNVGNEGMYIGNTHYFGQTVNCNGNDTLLLPSLLDGVSIYNNIVDHTGWDGIQVSSAWRNCQIYNNLILYDSQAEVDEQMSGIMLGGGSKCDCYNNYISNGKGDGIESLGLGGYRIFNNVIMNAGLSFHPLDSSNMKHGIFISDVSVQTDSSFYILFNDIINPKSDGIRFQSVKSRNNLIASNLILNPGNYNYYQQHGNIHLSGKDAYIMLPDSTSDVNRQHNFLSQNIGNAHISVTDFIPFSNSPLIDNAYSNNLGITFDYFHHPRPLRAASDIGAIEHNPISNNDTKLTSKDFTTMPFSYPDPVKSLLNIRFHPEDSMGILFQVYNLQGFVVLKKKVPSAAGKDQEIQIDVENLPAGVYLYSLFSGKTTTSGKFIKIR